VQETEKHWKKWVNKTPFEFRNLTEDIIDLFKNSLLIIKAHTDNNGAIIASSDSTALYIARDTYSFMWPRDGALITRAFDRGGYVTTSQQFYKFCAKILTKDGYFFHKYLPDGSFGSTWHSHLHEDHIQLPIQEDETAIILHGLWKHYSIYKDEKFIKELFEPFIKKASNFLLDYIDNSTNLPKESYDLWEEKLGIHTYTVASVFAGLNAAANFEELFGQKEQAKKFNKAAQNVKKAILVYLYDEDEQRFIKRVFHEKGELKKDKTNDASNFYGIVEFGVLEPHDPKVVSTVESFKKELTCKGSIGGYARYQNDQYYQVDPNLPGNPWFITTLWLADYYVKISKTQKDLEKAIELLSWVCRYALPTGILSEQLDPHTGKYLSATPLTWSHAAYVSSIIGYLEKLDDLGICKICDPVTK